MDDWLADCEGSVSPVAIDLDVFADLETLDFRFKPSFRPMSGFEPIPFDRIGLYRDAYRDSVYLRHEKEQERATNHE